MEVRHNEAAHRFEVPLGNDFAVLEYALEGKQIIFLHTGVPEAYEGKGIASQLVKTGLDYARSAGLTVVARCPYVKAYLERHPQVFA